MEQPKNDVLKVKRLHVEFQTSHGMVHAVKDVSLEVKRGRIHALVGERSFRIRLLLLIRFLQLNNCFWKD